MDWSLVGLLSGVFLLTLSLLLWQVLADRRANAMREKIGDLETAISKAVEKRESEYRDILRTIKEASVNHVQN